MSPRQINVLFASILAGGALLLVAFGLAAVADQRRAGGPRGGTGGVLGHLGLPAVELPGDPGLTFANWRHDDNDLLVTVMTDERTHLAASELKAEVTDRKGQVWWARVSHREVPYRSKGQVEIRLPETDIRDITRVKIHWRPYRLYPR
jgi:hypothetical protein